MTFELKTYFSCLDICEKFVRILWNFTSAKKHGNSSRHKNLIMSRKYLHVVLKISEQRKIFTHRWNEKTHKTSLKKRKRFGQTCPTRSSSLRATTGNDRFNVCYKIMFYDSFSRSWTFLHFQALHLIDFYDVRNLFSLETHTSFPGRDNRHKNVHHAISSLSKFPRKPLKNAVIKRLLLVRAVLL